MSLAAILRFGTGPGRTSLSVPPSPTLRLRSHLSHPHGMCVTMGVLATSPECSTGFTSLLRNHQDDQMFTSMVSSSKRNLPLYPISVLRNPERALVSKPHRFLVPG